MLWTDTRFFFFKAILYYSLQFFFYRFIIVIKFKMGCISSKGKVTPVGVTKARAKTKGGTPTTCITKVKEAWTKDTSSETSKQRTTTTIPVSLFIKPHVQSSQDSSESFPSLKSEKDAKVSTVNKPLPEDSGIHITSENSSTDSNEVVQVIKP